MKKQAKMSRHKWDKEMNSSDFKPKRNKRVYKKMKTAERREGVMQIEEFEFDSMYEDMFEKQDD
jgi:hypothetical protein